MGERKVAYSKVPSTQETIERERSVLLSVKG